MRVVVRVAEQHHRVVPRIPLRERRAAAEAQRAGGTTLQPIPPSKPHGHIMSFFHAASLPKFPRFRKHAPRIPPAPNYDVPRAVGITFKATRWRNTNGDSPHRRERLYELAVCQRLEEDTCEEVGAGISVRLRVGRQRKDRQKAKPGISAEFLNELNAAAE